jgi:hypothetical protein
MLVLVFYDLKLFAALMQWQFFFATSDTIKYAFSMMSNHLAIFFARY